MNDSWITDSGVVSLSTESVRFGQKTARSICEIQNEISSLSDILLFLEILGYNDKIAQENGFTGIRSLAGYVFSIIGYYQKNPESERLELKKSLTSSIPTIQARLLESFALVFPWIGSLSLLFVFGVSLWMAWDFPIEITTSFLIGVFVGLLFTEGIVQGFTRLFTYHYDQNNFGQVKNLLKNYYLLTSVLITGVAAGFLLLGNMFQIPIQYYTISIISMATVSIHRVSFMIIYTQRKFWTLIISYSLSLISLEFLYFSLHNVIPDDVTRYFVSLFVAFSVLSVFAAHGHLKIFKITSKPSKKSMIQIPHFYSNPGIIKKTLNSRFHIQIWEMIPYFVLGVFYFAIIFSDRLLSWVFNPAIDPSLHIPIAFNAIYHAGADMALLILSASMIVQYVVMTNLLPKINNASLSHTLKEWKKINTMLQNEYKMLLLKMMAITIPLTITVYILGPHIIQNFGGSSLSMDIMRIALLGNIGMSIFSINLGVVGFLNRLVPFLKIPAISACVVFVGGIFAGVYGFEYIVYGFLLGASIAAILSTMFTIKQLKIGSNLLFTKYV